MMSSQLAPNSSMCAVKSDYAQTNPGALLQSSVGRGWEHLSVMHFRETNREASMPPLSQHAVILHLNEPLYLMGKLGSQSFHWLARHGERAIVPSGTPTQWQCTNGAIGETLHLYLAPDFLAQTAADLAIGNHPKTLEPEVGVPDQRIWRVGMLLLGELGDNSSLSNLYADSLALLLAASLLEGSHAQPSRHETPPAQALPKYQLRRVLDYINDHLADNLHLQDIANVPGLSPCYFARQFKRATGIAPHQYVISQRLKEVKRLLLETELTVADIAYQVGFATQSRLTILFKRSFGATPTAYRRAAG